MSIEGQGHFFTIYFPGFVCFVLYPAKISGEHLQDHWSSGYLTDKNSGEKQCCHFLSAVFHLILFIVVGNDEMHEWSQELKIWRDSTTDCGVSCPLASEKIPIEL